eukprot:TRINITY_DN9437_c0_g1_i1.p2 TRINITY_DN9437_c0_g1~~TRINITY_DN9437_c0_g1_i1.p2  ORF type:complete len:50 (-),score=2.81 TRINITY_DN9437_c0_g1_i1:78-227(-)
MQDWNLIIKEALWANFLVLILAIAISIVYKEEIFNISKKIDNIFKKKEE